MQKSQHRSIRQGNIHGIVNWIVNTIGDLANISLTSSDLYKVARVATGADAGYYIYDDASNSEDVWVKLNNESHFVDIPPTSSTATGIKGQISADSDHFYICYDTDSWIRIPKDSGW